MKNFFKLLMYISFFPQLIAGPIVRYGDIAAQLQSRTLPAGGAAEQMGDGGGQENHGSDQGIEPLALQHGVDDLLLHGAKLLVVPIFAEQVV